MSSFFLSFNGTQIDEALSGANLLLRDTWGYTGNLNLVGEGNLSGVHAKKVATFNLEVTGQQTGHGSFTNLNFGGFNNFSATGNSYLKQVTGFNQFHNIVSRTGNLPYITGNSFFHNGDHIVSGDNIGFTGSDFVFQSDSNVKFGGSDLFQITGFDSLKVYSDSVYFETTDYRVKGQSYFTGNVNISGEVFVSGIKLSNITGATTNIINNISFDGDLGIGQFYNAKGDILVGTGISGASTLLLGTHGQLLQVDTGHQLGVKWVNSGIFAGGFGISGTTGLSGWYDQKSVGSNRLVPSENSFLIGVGNAVGNSTSRNFQVGFHNNTSSTASSVFCVGSGGYITESAYSTTLGLRNSIKSNSYSYAIGLDNFLEYGSHSFVGGNSNNIAGSGSYVFGKSNLLTGYYDGGFAQTIDNNDYKIFGNNNIVTGDFSTSSNGLLVGDGNSIINCSSTPIVLGSNNYQSGYAMIMLGSNNSNTGDNPNGSYNSVCIGNYGVCKRYGEFVWSINSNPVQSSDFMFYGTTSNNTITEIFLGGQSSSRLVIDSGKTMLLHFLVVAKTSTEMASYSIKVVAKNVAGTLTVTTTSLEVIQEDDSTWTVDFDADSTNKSVRARVTGATAKNITWGIKGFGIEI